MLHCFSSMSRNNTENWFEHNKATLTCSMTRVDSQCNTTGDCVPRQPAPRLPPSGLILQNSWGQTCRSLRWTCSVATALLQRFPCWISKDCKIIYLHQTSQWKVWSHSGFAPFPSHQSRATHHAEMSGMDWHTHTHSDHRAIWGEQASTHTLCAVGIAHSDKDWCTVASSCLWRLSDWSAEQSPALTSPKAILQFC